MEYEKLLRIKEGILSFLKLETEEPTPRLYSAWLQSLNQEQRTAVQNLEFEDGKNLISFQCYMLEQSGYSIIHFLKEHLSAEDYDYYLRLSSQPS